MMIFGLWCLLGAIHASSGAEPAFDVEALKRVLAETKPQTVEQALGALPRSLRLNAVLMRQSRSLQGSTPAAPRVIMWSPAGGLALSFNGDPRLRGYDKLELFQFDPKARRFHFLRVSFPGGQIDEPRLCTSCHGPDPRPIWKEYPSWTGAYGEKDDLVAAGDEQAEWSAFRAAAATHPRYQTIFPAAADAEFRPEFPFRANAHPGPENLSTGFAWRPNLRFGAFVARLNARRVARAAEDAAARNPARLAALAASVMSCPGALPLADALEGAGLVGQDLDIRNPFLDRANETLDLVGSYFDGTASSRELVAARLVETLSASGAFKDLEPARVLRRLSDKFSAETPVTTLDRPILDDLDSLGGWLPLPYEPTALTRIQKREPFRGSFAKKYGDVCAAIDSQAASR